MFTLHSGQIRTSRVIQTQNAEETFTLHTGQIRTMRAIGDATASLGFTLHSGQIRTRKRAIIRKPDLKSSHSTQVR